MPALIRKAAQHLLLTQRCLFEQSGDLGTYIGDQFNVGLGFAVAENAARDIGIHVEAFMRVCGLFQNAHLSDAMQSELAQIVIAIDRSQ